MYLIKDFTERVAVVIPMYKNELSDYEAASLNQCMTVLGKYPIIVVKPRSLNLTVLDGYTGIEFMDFDDAYFYDMRGYNRLMLWEGFYGRFFNYEYILIYQLDAFVFNDLLLHWCKMGYDYIGAPWLRGTKYVDTFKALKSKLKIFIHTRFNKTQAGTDLPTDIQFENKVGNGGLSLRKVHTFYHALKNHKQSTAKYLFRPEHYFNEDVWWSIELNRHKNVLKIPDYKTAVFFSIENEPERAFELTGHRLPFGCHAWEKYLGFWSDKIGIRQNSNLRTRKVLRAKGAFSGYGDTNTARYARRNQDYLYDEITKHAWDDGWLKLREDD